MRADQGTARRVHQLGAASDPPPASPHPLPHADHAPPPADAADGIRPRLLAEFVGLFILVPTLPVLGLLPVTVIPALVVMGLVCLVVLLRDPAFDRAKLGLGPRLVGAAHVRPNLRRIAAWFVVGAAGIAGAVILFDGQSLFSLIRSRPEIWAIIMIGYPVLSVYPQEMIFRTFLFHRYRPIFPARWALIAASAVAFGYAHIVLGNAIAVALSLAGGFLFAYTYDRTRSTLLCAIEHALYGCFIFTIGLGTYFYHGSMRAAEAAAGAGGL